jgi:hypothetical protein
MSFWAAFRFRYGGCRRGGFGRIDAAMLALELARIDWKRG